MPEAFSYPEPLAPPGAALVAIDLQLLPFVLGGAARLLDREYWQTDLDWFRANEAISQFLECSMSACLGDLLAQNDRLYRLLDSGLNGTVYTAAGDPVVVSPSIGDVPTTVAELPGLIARMDHLELMIDALPGVLTPGWFGVGGDKATIADVVKALRVGTGEQATEAIDSFGEILNAGSDVATMADSIFDMFTGSVSALEEGGIFLILAAASIGGIAAMGAIANNQITQMSLLNRIIHDLDGGGLGLSDDNVLQALRGDDSATSTRNVIDAIVAALASITTDSPDVLAKLEEIRELLA